MLAVRTFEAPFWTLETSATKPQAYAGNLLDLIRPTTVFVSDPVYPQIAQGLLRARGRVVELELALQAQLCAMYPEARGKNLGVLSFKKHGVTGYWASGDGKTGMPQEFLWRNKLVAWHHFERQPLTNNQNAMIDCIKAFIADVTSVQYLALWSTTEVQVTRLQLDIPWQILPPDADLKGALLLTSK